LGRRFRATHKKTSGWHFVDIPYERNTYEAAVDCKDDSEKGDCIINANDRVQKTLADCTKPNGERVEALKFLVHFVGDVHQPLHTAERNGDGGGNGVHVSFFGKNVNLHEVWDTEIIRHTVFAWGTYVSRLEEQWFAGRDLSGLDAGTPIDWALQSHKLAHDVAYDFPAGDPQLGKEYYTKRPTALCL
jgi:S1/P1 Nuclease